MILIEQMNILQTEIESQDFNLLHRQIKVDQYEIDFDPLQRFRKDSDTKAAIISLPAERSLSNL